MPFPEDGADLSRLIAFARFGEIVWQAHYNLGERKELSRDEIEELARVAGIAVPVIQLEECDPNCSCIRNMNGLPIQCLTPAFPEKTQP